MNGAVIELTEEELARLAIREIRYDAVDVTEQVDGRGLPERVWTFTAKEGHFAPEPPEDAVILAAYARRSRRRSARCRTTGSTGTSRRRAPTRSSGSRRRWSGTRSRRETQALVARRAYAACQRRAQSRMAPITGFRESPLLVRP